MGFHATLNAGTDAFGNMRHKSAPRVKATARVTGYDQQVKFHSLAGPVTEDETMPFVSDTRAMLVIMLAGRRITRLTATMNDYRKMSATRHVLKLRDLGFDIVVRKINPTKNNPRSGWGAYLVKFGDKNGHELAFVAKGSSIETNGERQDACRAALNTLHVALQAA